jgi:hypothetical protein
MKGFSLPADAVPPVPSYGRPKATERVFSLKCWIGVKHHARNAAARALHG